MSSLYKFKDFRNLYRLSKVRNKSRDDYFEFQKFQGELLVRFLQKNNCLKQGDSILDLGCAFGGYSSAFAMAKTRVIGLDLTPMKNPDGTIMLKGDANKKPLASNTFDLVVCASLIEHVPDTKRTIDRSY